jgi:uncharacterized surface protein with fasciclin (FAS1) repeats
MNSLRPSIIGFSGILTILIILSGCTKEFEEYYKVPEGLIGTILDVLAEDGNYTQFIKAVELVEYDDVLGKTGNFTVFAPDDNAFQQFFTESGYRSLEDIPEDELTALVFYHIVFWSYSRFKLLYGLGVQDATIEYATDNFKKETQFRPPTSIEFDIMGDRYTVYHENKYIPLFSSEYFDDQELDGNYDYTFFYQNTSFTGFNADRAEITEYDVPAQNGWIHRINKVLVPPDNHDKIFTKYDQFSDFWSLVEERRYYQYNSYYTMQQSNEGDIDDDGILDSLFLKKNTLLPSNYGFDGEDIGSNGQADLITVFAPTNQAMQRFLSERTSGYNSLDEIGEFWMDWYLSHYFGFNYWPSQFSTMTEDWPRDLTSNLVNSNVQEIDIIFKQMASNGPFIGIDKYLLPKVYETVARPIFGKSNYQWFCELLVFYMVDILINKEEIEFTVFAPSNTAMNNAGYSARAGLGGFGLYSNKDPLAPVPRSRATEIIKSHITFGMIDEADFEDGTFIKTIQNTYLGVEDGKIFGGEDRKLAGVGRPDHSGSNGVLYPIDRMVISPGRNILNILTDQLNNPEFEEFHKLLLAGNLILFDEDFNYIGMDNISTGLTFTAFVPTNEVILQGKADGTIPDHPDSLNQFLRYHFIEDVIFSDGKKSGDFPTTRYADLEENTFIEIEIINQKYNLKVKDNMGNTRQVTSANLMATNGVIHTIDSLLIYE